MKKLLYIFFILAYSVSVAQNTDTQLTTQANVIRNETQPAANTPLRVGNMFRALIDNKKNDDDCYKSAGSSNTYTITIQTGVVNFNNDFGFMWKVNAANSGAITLNPNGLGAKSVRKNYSTTLSSGDLTAGQIYPVVYDAEAGWFQIMLPGSGGGGGGGTWGSITGDITDQTDLQSALDGKSDVFTKITEVTGTSYTIDDDDANSLIVIANTGYTTITMPASVSDSLVFNFLLDINADSALFVGSGGASLDAVSDTLKTPGQAATWAKVNSTEYKGFGALGTSAGGGGSGATIVGDGNGTTGNGNASDLGGTLNQNTTINGAGIYSLSLGSSGSRLSTFTGEIAGASVWRTLAGNMSFRPGADYGYFSDFRMMRIYNGSSTPSYTGTHPNVSLQIQGSFTSFGGPTEFTGLLWLPNATTAHLNAISVTPPTGGFVYDSDIDRLKYYTGSAWEEIANLDDITGGGGGGQWYSLPPVTYTADHDLDFADTTKTVVMDVSGGDLELHVPESGTIDFNDGQIILILVTGNNDLTIVEDGAASVTSTSGSLAVTGSANPIYLTLQNVGGDDWVLSAPSAGGGGGGAVSSVFGRTGAVVAVAGDYDGTEVTNTPAGSIAATTTQAAINELDTEKQPIDSDLTTIAGLTATTNNFIQSVSSAWASRTPTQVTATLDQFTSGAKGLAPASGGGTTNFLRADGTWSAPAGSGTVNSGTAGQLAYYAGSGTAVSGTNAGTGVLTFLGTPSWTNFNSMITGTAPFWNTSGSTTVTTPTITGNITFTEPAASSGSATGWTLNGGAHTGLTQATEVNALKIDLSQTKQWTGGGTFTIERLVRILPATISATSSTTITTAATLGLRNPTAGTNVTLSKNAALITTDASDEVHVALATNSSTSGAVVLGAGGATFAAQPSIGAASKTTGTGAASGTALKFFGDHAGATKAAFQFSQLNGNSNMLNGGASVFIDISPDYAQSSNAGNDHSIVKIGGTWTNSGSVANTITSFLDNRTINLTSTTASTVEGFAYKPIMTSLNANSKNVAFHHTSGFVQWESVLSPAQITANQDDYNPTGLNNGGAPNGASIVRLSTDASRNITSIVGGVQGRLLVLVNVGSQNIVIKDDDGATGTAANRIQLNADITLLPEDSMMLWYDGTSSRWRSMK